MQVKLKEKEAKKQEGITLKMEQYEKIQKENKQLIAKFVDYLKSKGLGDRTIRNHNSNLELLNDYLSGYNETKLEEAEPYDIMSFLIWCIDKWMFNTISGLVAAISSIRIFYEYLQEKGIKKDIKEIIEICSDKDRYVKEFNKHEKLLGDY